MGGGSDRTIVLMGRTGNGKSSTGNSILGKPIFKSEMSLGGVTCTTESHSTTLTNGQVVNVIDTPGLFDFNVGAEFISKEIKKCVELANNGIHAVLLVCSVRGRFTEEEAGVIHSLQTFFGPKISDYMIVVFTGGDSLDEDQSLEDFLLSGPEPLQKILQLCKNRYFLVDNKTKDETKKALQLQKLFTLVDKMVEENGGQAYTDDLFSEFKEAAKLQHQKEEANSSKGHTKEELAELTEKIQKSYDDQQKKMMEMVESKLKETNLILQKQLEDEKAARLKAEKSAKAAEKRAKKSAEEAKKRAEADRKKFLHDAARAEQIARESVARAEQIARDAHNGCAIL